MKKIILMLLFLLLIPSNIWSAGVLDMTPDTSPTTDDITYVINDPGGTPGDRKVTLANIGKAIGPPAVQSVTCTDSGDANPGALTITPTAGLNRVDISLTVADAHGCTITMAETGAVAETLVIITNISAANTATFTTSAGVLTLKYGSPFVVGAKESLILLYKGSEWLEVGRVGSISGFSIGGLTASKGACSDADGKLISCTNLTDVTPLTSSNISDTAYDATSWDTVTTIAPSKNAVRDKIETLAPLVSPAFTTPFLEAATATSITVADVTNNNYLKITNNTTRAATASVNELYPVANVWIANQNGTGYALILSPLAGQINLTGTTAPRAYTIPDRAGRMLVGGAASVITPAAAATLTVALSNIYTYLATDNEDATITFSGAGTAGDEIIIIFKTAGTADEIITFHATLVSSTGTLTLGTTADKFYVIRFISDGAHWYEVSRTAVQT